MTGWLFVAPATLHLLVFAVFPILYALYFSFYRWDMFADERSFVAGENYARVTSDPSFWNAMKNSTVFTVFSVPLGAAVALMVALLVMRETRGIALFRTLFYFPAITSQVALAMVWIYVFLPKTGLINGMLGVLGLPNDTDFLNNTAWAMPALIFMAIWVGLGPKMVLFLAGLIGIPEPLYEAAALDGASGWTQFWKVTLPLLAPTTLFVLVTSTIAAFQVFTPVYMMTKGGPQDATDVVGYHIYTTAWRDFQIGPAAAQSFVLLAVILTVSAIQYKLMKRQVEGYSAA